MMAFEARACSYVKAAYDGRTRGSAEVVSGAPIVEKAVPTSERPSAVDGEGSLVLGHPSHVGANWAALALGVVLQALAALSLICGGRRCRKAVPQAERPTSSRSLDNGLVRNVRGRIRSRRL